MFRSKIIDYISPQNLFFWFLSYALASGNTYIVKVSEQVPMTIQGITKYIDMSGFPPGMKIHTKEIFGPVLVILRADTLDDAIKIINKQQYSNGASIYTQKDSGLGSLSLRPKPGMIGINIGILAPVAYLPFRRMKESLHFNIKTQRNAVINFFT